MKKIITVFIFMVLILHSVLARGNSEMEPANIQEIKLGHIDTIEIRYRFENITLYSHNSDTIIIKEYMTKAKALVLLKLTLLEIDWLLKRGRDQ